MQPEMLPTEFKQLRLQLGLSQNKLAREIGVSLNAVQRWEKGERPISGPVARLLRLLVEKQGWEQKAA